MAANVLVNFKGNNTNLMTAIAGVNTGLAGLQNKALLVGTALTGVTLSIAASSVRSFAAFDDALNSSMAIMGDLSDTMKDDLEQAALDVGSTMRISSTEAAESFFFLASAGLDAEQSIAGLPVVASFAQAGMFDMALATDLLTDAQSARGLTVDDTSENMENMTRISDVLVGANTLANASVQQFSEALTNRAGASLRELGKDVEEGVAVLAAFADQGIKGMTAGQQLGIVLRDLTTKAIKNTDAFAEHGIAVFDAQGEMRNMADIIEDLDEAFGHLSDKDRKAALLDIGFSDRSLAALTTLFGTQDRIREYEEELRAAGGTTIEISDKQAESFQAKMDILGNKWDNLKIRMGEPIANVVLDVLTDVESWFANNEETITEGLQSWRDDFETGWSLLEDLFDSPIIDDALDNFVSDFSTGFDKVKDKLDLGDDLTITEERWQSFKTNFLLGTIEISDKLGEWYEDFQRGWDLFEQGAVIVHGWVSDIKEDFDTGSIIVSDFVNGAIDDFNAGWGNFTAGIDLMTGDMANVWPEITTAWSADLELLRGVVDVQSAIMTGNWQGAVDGVARIAAGLWPAVTSNASAGWAIVNESFSVSLDVLQTMVGDKLDIVGDILSDRFLNMGSLANIGLGSLNISIGSAGSMLFETSKSLGNAILDGIKEGFGTDGTIVNDLGNKLKSAFKFVINTNLVDPINNALTGATQGINILLPGFGFDAPQIPRLMRGGEVSVPTLAIVGDTPGDSEIVSPKKAMREVVADALSSVGHGGPLVGNMVVYASNAGDVMDALEEIGRRRR